MLDIILFGAIPGFLTGIVVGVLALVTVQIWSDDNIRPSNPVSRLRMEDEGKHE